MEQQNRPTFAGYGLICAAEVNRILDGERTRTNRIQDLRGKASATNQESTGCEPSRSWYIDQAKRLTKSKVSFATVLTVFTFITLECSNRPGECYPLSSRHIVERSRPHGASEPMLNMRQVQRSALELERLGMLERWSHNGVEMWGIRFPDDQAKRRRRRTPPKKQSVASDARGVAGDARTSLNSTKDLSLQKRTTAPAEKTTTATHAPDSLESWLAAGRRDGVNLEEVEAMWKALHPERPSLKGLYEGEPEYEAQLKARQEWDLIHLKEDV